MKLPEALAQLVIEVGAEEVIAETDRDERCREQWMRNIHADILELVDDAGAPGRDHETVVTFSDDQSYADVTIDGVHLRWHANLTAQRGEWYLRPMRTVVRQCPNPECVFPGSVALLGYHDVFELADIVLADEIPPHHHDARRCDGHTAEAPPAPEPEKDRVIVLRESDGMFPQRLAELLGQGYTWTPCCTDAQGLITVIACTR